MAFPRMCVSLCPEYKIVEPSEVTCRLDPVYRHSLTPKISRLYNFIPRVVLPTFKFHYGADIPSRYADYLSHLCLSGIGFEQICS